jgi:hypothetical protein
MGRKRINDQFAHALKVTGESELSSQNRSQMRKRAKGICLDCARAAVGGGLYCEHHRAQRNARIKARTCKAPHHVIGQSVPAVRRTEVGPEAKPATAFFRR